MVTKKDIDNLETFANGYFMESERISFQIEDRQEELDGILRAYDGLRDVSSQILRQIFLKGGVLDD